MVRQSDDSFVCFGSKPDKGFWTWESRRDRKWVGEGDERVRQRDWEVGVGEGWREWPVDTGAERPVGWDEVQSSEGRRVKMSRHSSSFVEVSLESTLALVYTCTMLHNSPSALELTQTYCSFVLFSPASSIVFLVA